MTEPLIDLPLRQVAPNPLGYVRVVVDVALPHLDREWTYSVTPETAEVNFGSRVRVRFSGQLVDGWVVGIDRHTDVEQVAPLHKLITAEPAFTQESLALCRAVADHYAGSLADVLRLAVAPRHATTERAPMSHYEAPLVSFDDTALSATTAGSGFLDQVSHGGSPRACWAVPAVASPMGDWAQAFAASAAACLASGRCAILLAPDGRDLSLLRAACEERLGKHSFVVLAADQGPAARYRAYLAARRGSARVVVGTRAAAYAPVVDLGLVAMYDDGDDSWADPRAPYPHTREVVCLRANLTRCGLLLAGHTRTAEIEALATRDWVREVGLDASQRRRVSPIVRGAIDSDYVLERDGAAAAARLPKAAFTAARAGLSRGPVLFHVPRRGYRLAIACQRCRESYRCPHCGGPVQQSGQGAELTCSWCGRVLGTPVCPRCRARELRATRVGAARTATELARSFPGTSLITATAERPVEAVGPEPVIVVATPGAEPAAEGGYATAIILDGDLVLARADLRAAEEALRRWSAAVSLVQPAIDGGQVVVVADVAARCVQALIRHDPVGFAARELADREETRFPPAVRMVAVEGAPLTVRAFVDAVRHRFDAPPHEALGPVPVPGQHGIAGVAAEELHRWLLRSPISQGRTLVGTVRAVAAVWSLAKNDPVRIIVDPAVL